MGLGANLPIMYDSLPDLKSNVTAARNTRATTVELTRYLKANRCDPCRNRFAVRLKTGLLAEHVNESCH